MEILKRLTLAFLALLTTSLVLLSSWLHQNKELAVKSTAAKIWHPIIKPWASQPDVVAYYSFQDEYLCFGKLRNRASLFPTSLREIKFVPNSTPIKTAEGRWEGKQAVELDSQLIRLPMNGTDQETFSLSVWIKHKGLGSITGDNYGNIASVIALKDGRWQGWRIDLFYPSNRIGFYLARKQGEPPVGVISAIRVPPNTWTHLAVTRNTSAIRIYINGLLAGETPHDIRPSPISIIDSLKLGYIGTGYCSAVIQLDDLLIHSSEQPPHVWLSMAAMEPTELFPKADLWIQASNSFLNGDLAGTITQLAELKKSLPNEARSRYIIDYRLGEAYTRLGKLERAQDLYLDIILTSTAPENIRLAALHEYLVISQGVNMESDPTPFSYQVRKNYLPDEEAVVHSSYRYSNAISDYAYFLPLNEEKMQAIE